MRLDFFLKLFLIIISLIHTCFSSELAYSKISSPSELIDYETYRIESAYSVRGAVLASAYLDRAESYLLWEKYPNSLNDFQAGFEIAQSCNQTDQPILFFRSFLGLAIIYGILDQEEDFYIALENLEMIIKGFSCNQSQEILGDRSGVFFNTDLDTQEKPFFKTAKNERYFLNNTPYRQSQFVENQNFRPILIADQPLLGPDRIPINECLNRVEGLAKSARLLIGKARWEVQVILNILIDDLENRAKRCCRGGGLWKACLQPLANKWYLWNQKWQVFNIPPDPSWD